MAKYLDLTGLKYFITKRIGKTDISKIGDGTCTGAISALNQSLGNDKWEGWDGSKLPNNKKLIMIMMQCHNNKSYGVSTFIIPISKIVEGVYVDNTAITCTSPDGYISSLTFTITKAGVFKNISLKSNNQYYIPKYVLYCK